MTLTLSLLHIHFLLRVRIDPSTSQYYVNNISYEMFHSVRNFRRKLYKLLKQILQ